jgi:glycerol-3-phosphate dehydrogenase subunit B
MNRYDTIYDVMVIGSGFAGMAATLFAAERGLKVAQTGATGGIDFSTGFLDLMAVHPVAEGRYWDSPWDAIDAVIADHPAHPYARLGKDRIRTAMNDFTEFLRSQKLEYMGHEDRNTPILSPAGTVKRTYRIPRTAWKGTEALRDKAPTLIVDFNGLKGFSGRQIVEMQHAAWPALKTVRVDFPGSFGELYPEHMAWTLSSPERCRELADSIAEQAKDVEYIGFPAVLGLNDPVRTVTLLEELTGKHVFEIPTLPPSITGPRLRATFDRGLAPRGVCTFSQKLVLEARRDNDGLFTFLIGVPGDARPVKARNAILATGRFFGKGLRAERNGVVEPIFGIPVTQPAERTAWHHQHFFDRHGHAINMSGIEVDDSQHPLDAQGKMVHDNLYAAGAIQGHHDWMRMKCGAGIAIATAYRAVESICGTAP